MLTSEMNNATADYVSVLMTFTEELSQKTPHRAVLESCRQFILKMPLPDDQPDAPMPPMRDNVIRPAVKHWGKPRGANYVDA